MPLNTLLKALQVHRVVWFRARVQVVWFCARVQAVWFCARVQVVWFCARVCRLFGSMRVCLDVAPDASPKSRVRFVSGSRVQMGPSGMVWESSATGLGRTGQPKSQANRKALQGPYKAL